MPNACFNSKCRNPVSTYIPSDARNLKCPNICAGIIYQDIQEGGILDNENIKVNMSCGTSSVVDLDYSSNIKNVNTKNILSKSKDENSDTNNSFINSWIFWLIISVIIVLIIILIILFSRKII